MQLQDVLGTPRQGIDFGLKPEFSFDNFAALQHKLVELYPVPEDYLHILTQSTLFQTNCGRGQLSSKAAWVELR